MPQLIINRRLALAGLLFSAAPAAFAQTLSDADAKYVAFLDACFDESLALSPEGMTSLGLKTDYGKLDDYTAAGTRKASALAETQLARMKAQFDRKALSPLSQTSWALFERNVAESREQLRWRDHSYQATTNGSAAGEIPVFLINNHRVDTVADADAYVSR
ncbi:MAG: hypothetical protein JWM33_3646, partial [Caulobacteraceae bacterium]|nr:hypothetical protein [Caulobacteraceae bacterium]